MHRWNMQRWTTSKATRLPAQQYVCYHPCLCFEAVSEAIICLFARGLAQRNDASVIEV